MSEGGTGRPVSSAPYVLGALGLVSGLVSACDFPPLGWLAENYHIEAPLAPIHNGVLFGVAVLIGLALYEKWNWLKALAVEVALQVGGYLDDLKDTLSLGLDPATHRRPILGVVFEIVPWAKAGFVGAAGTYLAAMVFSARLRRFEPFFGVALLGGVAGMIRWGGNDTAEGIQELAMLYMAWQSAVAAAIGIALRSAAKR